VLIVDDQPAIRLLLRELFELEGVTVYEAPNGRTAIQQVRRNRVDFILLDLKMPDMDGIEALREIRTFNSSVLVAMITAYGDPEKLETAKKLGTLAFFTKPFDIEYVKDFVMVRLKQEAEQGREGDVS
jgi:CheY-like chemotaxis protein